MLVLLILYCLEVRTDISAIEELTDCRPLLYRSAPWKADSVTTYACVRYTSRNYVRPSTVPGGQKQPSTHMASLQNAASWVVSVST